MILDVLASLGIIKFTIVIQREIINLNLNFNCKNSILSKFSIKNNFLKIAFFWRNIVFNIMGGKN